VTMQEAHKETRMAEITTPTLDKIRTVHGDSQRIGEFLEWLQADQHIALMVWREIDDSWRCAWCEDLPNGPKPSCRTCHGTGIVASKREMWVPDGRSIEQLLAAYFDIDLQQAAEEKQAVYEALAARASSRVAES
jgi:hypothetical protein